MSETRAAVERLLQQPLAPLEPLPAGKLVIYGAGGCGRSLGKEATARGFEVCAFLDARAGALGEVDGIPCWSPTSAQAHDLATAGTPVVMAVFNYASDLRPIRAALQTAGFRRILSFYEIHALFGLAPQFWLRDREYYSVRAAEILDGFDLFEDEESQRVFHQYLALRLTFDVQCLAQPAQANHYLPGDLPAPQAPMRLVDGGAFDGDTVRAFLAHGVKLEAVAAFEPDPANFRLLSQSLSAAKADISEAILFPCGLGRETAISRFSAGAGAGSSLDQSGETVIQLVALDEVLPTFRPSFIKLDVEGAEPEALRGAAVTIARHQPRLAVCVYHAPDHLWTIPALVRELEPRYRLALRYHQFNGFDVVLYAFARE